MAEGKRFSMKYSSKGTFKLSPDVLMKGASLMSVGLTSWVNHFGFSVMWIARVGLYAGSEGGCCWIPPGMRDIVCDMVERKSLSNATLAETRTQLVLGIYTSQLAELRGSLTWIPRIPRSGLFLRSSCFPSVTS